MHFFKYAFLDMQFLLSLVPPKDPAKIIECQNLNIGQPPKPSNTLNIATTKKVHMWCSSDPAL